MFTLYCMQSKYIVDIESPQPGDMGEVMKRHDFFLQEVYNLADIFHHYIFEKYKLL